MDAFYASVSLLRYPQLAGLPLVVGGGRGPGPDPATPLSGFARLRSYQGRGVATTASYEARRLGVHSAMGLMKAAALAPDAILLPADFDEYRRVSRLFKDALQTLSPLIQDVGIDEVYVDVSTLPEASPVVAARLKAAVRDATGLSCSVGLAPNKLLAKLSSDMQKPDGVTILTMDDLASRVWPLAAQRINGIGPKAAARLASLGIETIGQLAERELGWLVQNFGHRYGHWLHEVSRGLDERPLVTDREPVSMSRETTFDRNLHAVRDRTELGGIFTRLCQKLGADLRQKGYAGRTVGIKLRFDDFTTVTRERTLTLAIDDAAAIREAAGRCLKHVDLSRSLRLLGVRITALQRPDEAGHPDDSPQIRLSLS